VHAWRIAAIGALAALIAVIVLGPAEAGPKKTKVLKPTKTIIVEDQIPSGDEQVLDVIAECPNGWQVTGGGYDFQSSDPESVIVLQEGPLVRGDNLIAEGAGRAPAGDAYRVKFENTNTGAFDVAVGAICTKPVKVIN
jgi:hypothetical protein